LINASTLHALTSVDLVTLDFLDQLNLPLISARTICSGAGRRPSTSARPTLLAKLGANVTTILRRVRSDAGYDGQLVIVNYSGCRCAGGHQRGKAANARGLLFP
jgi:hypothetical protein